MDTGDSSRNSKPRRKRPSRARGLRASTGCLTCRRRRVKCDESQPRCSRCEKADRECAYATTAVSGIDESRPIPATQLSDGNTLLPAHPKQSVIAANGPFDGSDITVRFQSPGRDFRLSPAEARSVGTAQGIDELSALEPAVEGDNRLPGPGISPTNALPFPPTATSERGLLYDWYDLLAQDALKSIQRDNLAEDGPSWPFNEATLSRRQSPVVEVYSPEGHDIIVRGRQPIEEAAMLREIMPTHPWTSATKLKLQPQELVILQYYAKVVGPILDLFDPVHPFSNMVPHLAMCNVGLLKSVLAVAARHMQPGKAAQVGRTLGLDSNSFSAESPHKKALQHFVHPSGQVAAQYYYETLQYLSQNLLYPGYSRSHEIVATAVMISTYEMFDSDNTSDWERHLRGSFWIHRSQENNGESADSLRRAVWWAWLRQDIWAAFREKRPPLTIFQPQRRLETLTTDELCNRVTFLAAKCVAFFGNTVSSQSLGISEMADWSQRRAHGDELLAELEEWHRYLPESFQPISTNNDISAVNHGPDSTSILPNRSAPESRESTFEPIWIHPPAHAAAIQVYHFARIAVLLNQPSPGGVRSYRIKRKLIDESIRAICGIASAQLSFELEAPSAFISVQALYAAGLCVESRQEQLSLARLLEVALEVSKIPSSPLTSDLAEIWHFCG